MHRNVKLAIAVAIALVITGCSNPQLAKFQVGLETFNNNVQKYVPIIGKNILLISNILVTAECSSINDLGTTAVSKILTITAPNSTAVKSVQDGLATNVAVAQALCPLVAVIKAQVGSVPNETPSQVVNLSTTVGATASVTTPIASGSVSASVGAQ